MGACEKATHSYPGGRKGTPAGYQAHYKAGENACKPCLKAVAEDQLKKKSNSKKDVYRRKAYELDPLVNRKNNLKAKFGITIKMYDRMLTEQGGKCAICGSTDPGGRWGTNFMVDHDHSCCPGQKSCGKCIRGLLCASCNVGLGAFSDEVDRIFSAASYLMTKTRKLEVKS